MDKGDSRLIVREYHPYRHPIPSRRKYEFADMNVGDRLIIPIDPKERPSVAKGRVDNAVRNWKRRHHFDWWRFVIEYDDDNVYLYRVDDIMTKGK
jgi:hypothetical protein